MRYVGQSFELAIPLATGEVGREELQEIVSRFHREHQSTYGTSVPDDPVEIVNVRLTAIGQIANPNFGRSANPAVQQPQLTR